MDKRTLIQWVSAAVARGIAWFLAVKLGMAAAEADVQAEAIAGALAAAALAGLSIYSSVKGRRTLQAGDGTHG